MAAAFTLAVFSRAGSLALAAAAVAVIVGFPHEGRPVREHRRVMSDCAMEFMWSVLAVLVIPVGALLLLLQVGLLFFAPPPPNRLLAAMVVLEGLLACSTWGAACAALAVKLHAAGAYNVCVKHLSAAAMACVAGALAAVSALGMLWTLGSRFRRRAQA